MMRIAVLFDGAGLARPGLEQAGHECTGVELDPHKHYLSQFVGSGNCVLGDATTFDLSEFDGVWASPPCQWHSDARTQGDPKSEFSGASLLDWSLGLPHHPLWVENVTSQSKARNGWGYAFNAAQFEADPRQCRNRIIGGRYWFPETFRDYRRSYPDLDLCPAVTATEYKGCASDTRRASRWYGRRLQIEECAHQQGLTVPAEWYEVPRWWKSTPGKWRQNLYEAIGNGVPVYMARAFGEAHSDEAHSDEADEAYEELYQC